MRLIAVLLASAVLMSCAARDEDAATRALTGLGFKEIELHSVGLLSLSCDEAYRTGFKAKSADGVEVTGVVCTGFLKRSTVRFD